MAESTATMLQSPPSPVASFIFTALHSAAYGAFVCGLIFDITYFLSQEIFWLKAASWLNFYGLVLAIIPRLINLWRVWISRSPSYILAARRSFWLNFLAIIIAIFNAFVHSRDAWGVMPAGLLLSVVTVVLLLLATLNDSLSNPRVREIP